MYIIFSLKYPSFLPPLLLSLSSSSPSPPPLSPPPPSSPLISILCVPYCVFISVFIFVLLPFLS